MVSRIDGCSIAAMGAYLNMKNLKGMTMLNTKALNIKATRSLFVSLQLLLSSIFIMGCATKEEAPTFTADSAAFDFAVNEAVIMQLYTEKCAAFGDDMADLANEAKLAWNGRNWAQVHVADKMLRESMSENTVKHNGEIIALQTVKMKDEVEEKVARRLDQSRRTYSSVLRNCTIKLEGYRDGLDLSEKDSNADLYLRSLVASTPAVYSVPSLAGSLRILREPGRSQYNIERSLQKWDCANGEILTLVNEWPNEAYGVYCANKKTLFITCSWGDCESK